MIGCAPAASVEVVKVAVAPESAAVPSVVAPSKNVTVPVGVPAPGAVTDTVAVIVTDWPKTDGLTFEVAELVVAA